MFVYAVGLNKHLSWQLGLKCHDPGTRTEFPLIGSVINANVTHLDAVEAVLLGERVSWRRSVALDIAVLDFLTWLIWLPEIYRCK